MLTLAQITDIHICTARDGARKDRAEARLRQTLRAIMALRPRPVGIVASGDLTETGDPDAYADFWAIVRQETDLPVYPGLGNHDLRAQFIAASAWPADRLAQGFVQYVVDLPEGLRLVMCDTLEEGLAGGGFCAARAGWLIRTLAREPARPTVVALHHPPIASGIQWMDPAPDEAWIARLGQALSGQAQVLALMCGHLHRPFTSRFAGKMVTVAAATDIQLTLDLTHVDLQQPDGREILLEEPPGYALHMWREGQWTTHFCLAGPYPPAVMYNFPFRKGMA
jgi:3',5'-cyclic AMP phosphodiesterase CpdA